MPSFTARPKALLKLQSPDQLDQRVKVVQGWTWTVLIGLIGVIVAVVVWAALAWMPTSIATRGYVIPSQGWNGIESPVSGTVKTVKTGVNSWVFKGTVVATVESGGHVVDVRAPSSGSLAEVNVAPGDYVEPGSQLLIVSSTGGTMVVHAFFPVNTAHEIAPGSAVNVKISTAPPAAFGYLRGRVVQVATLPATDGYLNSVLLNPTIARQVTAHGPVVDVLVALDRGATPSGYRWTIGNGPKFSPVSGGLPTTVSITIDRKHPLSYVF